MPSAFHADADGQRPFEPSDRVAEAVPKPACIGGVLIGLLTYETKSKSGFAKSPSKR